MTLVCQHADAPLRRGPDVDRLRAAERALEGVYRSILRPLSAELRSRLLKVARKGGGKREIAAAVREALSASRPDKREVSAALKEHAERVSRITQARASDLIDKALGSVRFDESPQNRKRRVAAALKANAAGAPLLSLNQQWIAGETDRIGTIRFEAAEAFADSLREGLEAGHSVERIEQGLSQQFNRYMRASELIGQSRTQWLGGVQSQARFEAAQISRYTWQTQQDDRVRELHESYQGRVFSWDEEFEDGPPGTAPNCRCYSVPVIPQDLIDQEIEEL